PELGICNILYLCPCISTNSHSGITTETPTNSTNESGSATSTALDTSTEDRISSNSVTSSTSVSETQTTGTMCLATQTSTDVFVCKEKGRFVNPQDTSCSTYFLCSLLRNGTFMKTEYPCP